MVKHSPKDEREGIMVKYTIIRKSKNMKLVKGTLLQGGKYKIVRFLSNGGFGNTYEGVHTMMNTRVAIKEFFPKMFCTRDENTSHVTVATSGNHELVDKLRKKFNEEAKAVFKMKHDSIVRVLDIFEENGTAYYVMEYIDGKSLNDIVKERGALSEAEAVGYIRQVADALKYVHSLNRLHLDIKPGNIMVDKNGQTILIDFGASKQYDEVSGENTSTLLGINTIGYAPAEQSYRGFVQFAVSTDIYALGATLYKLLTGLTPPDAQMLKDGEVELPTLPPHITAPVKNAIKESMRPLRKDRPQSIDEFLSIINSCEIDSDDERTIFKFEEENCRKTDSEIRQAEFIHKAIEEAPKIEEKETSERLHQQQETSGKWKILVGLAVVVVAFIAVIMFSNTNNLSDSQIVSDSNTDMIDSISDSQDYTETQNQLEAQREAEAQRQLEAQREAEVKRQEEEKRQVEAQKAYENFNVSVKGRTFNNGYQEFLVLSVRGTDKRTIVNKRCTPSPETYMYCSPEEFIEDCATGKRYYLNGSSVGVNKHKEFYDTNPFYYSEYYPKLPNSVTRINISSGSFYYAKNVRIR